MPASGAYAFEGVNTSLLHEVHTTFTGFLFNSLGANPRWTQGLAIANPLPTRGNVAKAKMAARAYGVHEWVDERWKSKIEHFEKEVVVKKWANAIQLKIDDLEDEAMNLDQYQTLIAQMADDFVEHRHSLLIDLLANGFTGATAYDNQHFFDSDHTYSDGGVVGQQSNVSNAAFSETALYNAIIAMEKTRNRDGTFANISPTHGVFPVALRSTVEYVLNSEFRVDATNGTKNNLLKNRIIPIFDPRLDVTTPTHTGSTTAWFLLDLSKALKPFFMADRKAVTPQMKNTEEFEEGTLAWGAYARYNAAHAFHEVAWGSTGA